MKINDRLLNDLVRKAKRATPGPWKRGREGYDVVVRTSAGVVVTLHRAAPGCELPNGAHIAANTPEVTLALVAEIKRLRKAAR